MNKDEMGKEIINLLYNSGMIKLFPKDNKDGWTLHSGKWSPFYIQLRPLFSKKNSKLIIDKIGDAMSYMIETELGGITKLVGVATAGIPISVIASYKSGIPLCYTRKIEKARTLSQLEKRLKELDAKSAQNEKYGEHKAIEGDLEEGDDLLLIDDLITDGKSKLIAKRLVEYQAEKNKIKVKCNNVAVVFDREQGGKKELKEYGVNLYSLIPFKTKGIYWLKDKLEDNEFNIIQDYLKDDSKYQDKVFREKLFKDFSN